MTITERDVEENAEVVKDLDVDEKQMKEYFLVKMIVDVKEKKVVIFDANNPLGNHIIFVFNNLVFDEVGSEELSRWDEPSKWKYLLDRFVGVDVYVPVDESDKTIKIVVGFSSVEMALLKSGQGFHSEKTFEVAKTCVIKDVVDGDIPFERVVVRTRRTMDGKYHQEVITK